MSDTDFKHPLWTRVDRSGGPSACWPFTLRARLGARSQYGNYRGTTAHRRAFEVYHGVEVQKDLVVRHDCDRPICCNPAHLRLGTPADNTMDAVIRGRFRRKLTVEAALDIYTSQRSAADLAATYGVSKGLVYFIRNGRAWTHITGAAPRVPRRTYAEPKPPASPSPALVSMVRAGRRWTHVPDAPGGAR